ncbi:pyruvate formate lyase family protein [Prolixibacter denitrificans]|uniref:Pyruvate-formate lyase n=2 Tax=Prolixibacter denitrificans TaxID=1541063 RepID=A0A2P8CK65_9BACT|nr:pyruvate formate lyase family protein [Prolixibacter denitrificans]PSK85360.1 pyruvate-formate lyase [Prolixibacter denitrificans]
MKSLRRKICIMEKFTRVYQEFQTAEPSVRELNCLEVLFPATMQPVGKKDRFVGRVEPLPIGISIYEGYLGYFYDEARMQKMLEHPQLTFKQELRLRTLEAFWRGENSVAKIRSAQRQAEEKFTPDKMRRFRNHGVFEPYYRISGINPDYAKLVQVGIPGLRAELQSIAQEDADDKKRAMINSMLGVLDILVRVINQYAVYARDLSDECIHEESKAELLHMASALETISDSKPTTFREAVQLIHLFSLLSGTGNYGRLDVALGDFLKNDIESGELTEELALQLMESFWRLINARQLGVEGRLVIGGEGRPNEEAADRFAKFALRTSASAKEALPQICLRYYEGQDESLFTQAAGLLSAGNINPLLFNDSVLIPYINQICGVSEEEAEQYIPNGNGGFVIWHRSIGGPAGAVNLLKILELSMNGGRDFISGVEVGPDFGKFAEFHNLDGIWDAFSREVEYFVEALAIQEEILYTVMNREASFIFASLLHDQCISDGHSILDDDIPFLGSGVEVAGIKNVGDSLAAIESVVFQDKLLYPVKLSYIIGEDYEGFENERELLSKSLYRRNIKNHSDDFIRRIEQLLSDAGARYAKKSGMHHFAHCPANGKINMAFGRKTAASADGRKAKTLLDCSLNHRIILQQHPEKITFPDTEILQRNGMHLFQVSKNLNEGQQITILEALRQLGVGQMVISVLDRNTLEAARRDPENYRDVMVRLGSGTVRFVELDSDTQEQIIIQLDD